MKLTQSIATLAIAGLSFAGIVSCTKEKKTEGITYPYTKLVGSTFRADDGYLLGRHRYNYITFNSKTSASLYTIYVGDSKRLDIVECTLKIDESPDHIDSFEVINKDQKVDKLGFTGPDPDKIKFDSQDYLRYDN